MASLDKKKKLARLLKRLGSPEAGAIEIALTEMEKLQESIPSPIDISPIYREIQSLNVLFSRFENVVSNLNKELTSKLSKDELGGFNNLVKDTRKEFEKSIDELRISVNERFANRGGGSMNRQIKVNGVDYLTRYTDINLIGSITAADNDTQRRVDITFTGGSGFNVLPITGADGSNTSFHVDNNPKIIYLRGQALFPIDGFINVSGSYDIVLTDNNITPPSADDQFYYAY